MVRAVEGERGALPLLAFALARLWEKRDREAGLLTRQAYQDIGGVGGALARHAEATMDRIGSERIGIVRELFRNLVTAEGTDDSSTKACMADPCKFDARLRPYPIAGDTSRRIPAANAMAGMWNFPLAL